MYNVYIMDVNKIKLTNEIIDKTMNDVIPPSIKFDDKEEINISRLFLSNHFINRFQERLCIKEDIPFQTRKDIAIKILRGKEDGCYRTSSRKKNKDTMIINAKFNNIPLCIPIVYDEVKDVYLAITIYVWLTPDLIDIYVANHEKDQDERRFMKQLHERIYGDLSEEEFFNQLNLYKTSKEDKKKFSVVMKKHQKEYVSNFDLLDKEKWNEIVDNTIIEESNNSETFKNQNESLNIRDIKWSEDELETETFSNIDIDDIPYFDKE